VKKTPRRSCRPTGRRDPTPADLAYGALDLAARADQARRGESIGLYADATILWRCALPRAGWWRTAQRARLPRRPLRQRQITREASLTRQAWLPYRPWSRLPSGVWLRVMGALQDGTATGFSNIVPPCEAQERRQDRHPVRAIVSQTDTAVGMVVDRSGSQRAPQLDATLEPSHGPLRCHGVPAHGGHHLHPMEGVWRVRKATLGAGRCFGHLQHLSQRTRRVLMVHQERPISALHW